MSLEVTALVVAALVAVVLAVLRLLAGPTHADRLVAQDVLFSAAILCCVAAALHSGSPAFLDVGLGLAVVGFVATVGWARLLQRAPPEEER